MNFFASIYELFASINWALASIDFALEFDGARRMGRVRWGGGGGGGWNRAKGSPPPR